MLKTPLLHPDLSRALAAAGHGAKVLLADANYPLTTRTARDAARIYLNLAPGLLGVTDVLDVLISAIPIEAAQVMVPDSGPEPDIFQAFRRLLQRSTGRLAPAEGDLSLSPLDRFAFYAAASADDVAVAVATGEQRIYANILLTIGVVSPP